MATVFRPRTLVLFAGDIAFFVLSLWLTLFLRALELPSQELFARHLAPFAILFAVWVAVFFIAGLYESRSIILARRALSSTLLITQTINTSVAALFFFLVPLFGIAPKTVLFIYLLVSFGLILLWRAFLFPRLGVQSPEPAVVVGEREEVLELAGALARAPFAPARIVGVVKPSEASIESATELIATYQPRFIIADFADERVARFLPARSTEVRLFDALELYEEVFGRVPLSTLTEQWVVQNAARPTHLLYDPVKRVMDVAVALPAALVSLVCYPFIILAQKLYDRGHIFYSQVRVGSYGRPFVMVKFRSMSGADSGSQVLRSQHVVTPVGKVLRKTRLDELPQLWSVIKGDMSLIGPRPEFPALVEQYAKDIPFYNVRHLVKPGLSGWAQLYHDNHPHHGTNIEATREKLSYDLYYLKHRSLALDAVIVLKTIKKLLTRSGV